MKTIDVPDGWRLLRRIPSPLPGLISDLLECATREDAAGLPLIALVVAERLPYPRRQLALRRPSGRTEAFTTQEIVDTATAFFGAGECLAQDARFGRDTDCVDLQRSDPDERPAGWQLDRVICSTDEGLALGIYHATNDPDLGISAWLEHDQAGVVTVGLLVQRGPDAHGVVTEADLARVRDAFLDGHADSVTRDEGRTGCVALRRFGRPPGGSTARP